MISLEVTFMQPCLEVNAASGVQHSSTVYVEFANWFKGDKGDKGDTPDTSNLQTKTDNALQTSDKTIVGAINEINNKLPNTLPVTITGTAAAPIFTFTKANFDLVAQSYANGSQIFVDITDNRTATNKPIDLSYRYNAVWNKTLSQIEISNPNVASGFYLNGVTPANRGCVSNNTAMFMKRDPSLVFNAVTGFYEYNELLDISESEMLSIYVCSSDFGLTSDNVCRLINSNIRTNYKVRSIWAAISTFNINRCFYGVGKLQTINLESVFTFSNTEFTVIDGGLRSAFYYTHSLKKIIGIINISANTTVSLDKSIFQSNSLESLNLKYLKINIDFSVTPKLSKESLVYLITNRANAVDKPIIVTLHPTAYTWASVDADVLALLPATATQGVVNLASA